MAPRLQSEKSNKTQEKISQGCFFINLQPQGTVCSHFRFHRGSKVSERRISFIGEERGNAGSLRLASIFFGGILETGETLIDLQIYLPVLDWLTIHQL